MGGCINSGRSVLRSMIRPAPFKPEPFQMTACCDDIQLWAGSTSE